MKLLKKLLAIIPFAKNHKPLDENNDIYEIVTPKEYELYHRVEVKCMKK